MFRRPCTVLLTAAVRPTRFDVANIVRADVATRLADYADGLRFWGSIDDDRVAAVVFCDNSGENLSPLRDVVEGLRRPVEFLGFTDDPPPPDVHYGYGELGIIDFAIHNSRLMEKTSFFIKCTGRLRFPRISALLDALPDDISGAVDHRRRYRCEADPPTRARTQLMLLGTEFYRNELLGRRVEMPGLCSHIEHFLALRLGSSRYDPPLLRRFPLECPPSGVGSNGKRYDSLEERCRSLVRALGRRWLPNLWL